MKRFFALAALAVAPLAACAAPSGGVATGEDAEDVAQTEEALTTCGKAKYAEALAHYKNAVAWSKDRLASGVCESENGFMWSIADEASRAVMTCGQFRTILRTSRWAAPVRTVLAPSLTLESLTGELLVIKDSKWANWTGTETFFQRGVTFWARAEGAYGSSVRVDFRDGGEATWGEQTYDAATGEIGWRELPATYVITKTGSASAARRVTVTAPGRKVEYVLGVDAGWSYKDAPIFVLEPVNAGTPKLHSLVSECDA